jgi:putative toxin-antitoxin system antitoxin component (TIGR02293 family)
MSAAAAEVAGLMGGERVLRRPVRSDLDLADMIHEGLPTRALDAVVRTGAFAAAEMYGLVIPRRTLAHRMAKNQPLSPEQSDRLVRVVRAFVRAGEALASREKAARWLRKENRALGGRRPLDLLESDVGARLVERILGRIEHGVYS